jgi:hypothetical protein
MIPSSRFRFFRAVALSLAASGCLVQPLAARTHFRENFRNYRDLPPVCATNLGITAGNDPVWKQTAEANCRMTESGLVFKEFLPAGSLSLALENYDLLFRFRFQSEGERRLELRLRLGDPAKPGEVILAFSSNAVQATSAGLRPALTAAGSLAAPIPNNEWRRCVVTVKAGRLKLWIDDNRVFKPVLDCAMGASPFAGFNVAGFKDCGFSITDLEVRDPAPLPNLSVTRLLPAPRIPEPASFITGVEQTDLVVAAADSFGVTLRTGLEKASVRMMLAWNDGRTNVLTFGVAGIPQERKVKVDGKETKEKYELPDAIIQVTGIGGAKGTLAYHIRPKLRRYHTSYSFTDAYRDIIRDWELLPRASEHPLKVECRRTAGGVDLYLDGCFAGSLTGGVARSATFTLADGASSREPFSKAFAFSSDRYLPLDVGALGMAKAFSAAKPSLKPGLADVKGLPMIVTDGAGSADIGLTREGQGNWALEVDEYLARSPFDGLLTEVHFSVPGAPYSKAWVLCAVDPDPAKVPLLTARLARYVENGTGNNTLADTLVTLPRGDEKPGRGITPVGAVTKTGPDGAPVSVPLFLVEIPLKTGAIIDLAMASPVLNFEFFGKPWENFEQIDNTSKPDPDSTSAVQVFGVTLEKSPVGLVMEQSQPANVFVEGDKLETGVKLVALAAAKGSLAWEILDVSGRPVGKAGSVPYQFSRAGEERRVTIPLAAGKPGWYELTIALRDEAGAVLIEHPARFALLARDERKAGSESPFGTWWFDGAHNTPKELAFAGPVMLKAGIRKVAWTGQKEKELAAYKLTKDQFNMPFSFRDLATAEDLAKDPEAQAKKFEAAVKRADETVTKQLADHPSTREVLVFHESGPGNDIPLEVLGLKPEPTEAQVKREKRYADVLNLAGKYFREKHPRLKLVVGNNSCAAACIAAILRHGGNPDYIDYIGIEAPSQVFIPEKLQEWALQGHHIAQDTARALAGRAIPATGCYEFTYRCDRDMGEQQQAEWYTRDVLISLANGFTRIGPGILFDASAAYHNGLWGGSGILQRGPHGYPKKAYVAYATATRMLDQAAFKRQIPTGSITVYAVEFQRPDKRLVTALWASRGEAEFVLEFAGDTAVQVVGMYGDSETRKTAGGKVTVKAGTAPAYVTADRAIRGITLGARSFPADAVRAKLAAVAAPLDAAGSASVEAGMNRFDTPKTAPLQSPVRQAGAFSLKQVQDESRGACLELTLDTNSQPTLSKYVTEYAVLRLAEPAAVAGAPAALGVWVKGNSGWGRILYEIRDAGGEVWRSLGTSGWGCDILDWPGNAAVNFDGWNFVAMPLRASSLFHDHSPGPVLEQWVSEGGDKRIDYPIAVTALIVEMNRTALDLVDFKPVVPSIRLKDISGIAEPGRE